MGARRDWWRCGGAEAVVGCKHGAEMVEREELPLAARNGEKFGWGGRVAIGSCCELPKNGSGEGRISAAASCGELPESGGDGGKGWGCCEQS